MSIHITPKIDDLIPNKIFKCSENECSKEFTNSGNLQMHLIRHHKREELQQNRNEKKDLNKLYFCPIENCTYNELSESKKHFISIKYLRQHYQKVHLEKSFGCSKCKKMFCTEIQKQSHEINCNGEQKFVCKECNWSYSSREALLTHAKRKNHKIDDNNSRNNATKIKINNNQIEMKNKANDNKIISYKRPIVIILKPEMKDKTIQTEAMTFAQPQTTSTNRKSKAIKRDQNSNSKVESNSKRIKHVQIQTNTENESPSVSTTNTTAKTHIQSLHSSSSLSKAPKTKNEFFNLNLYEATDTNSTVIHNQENLNNLNYVDDNTVSNCFDEFVNSGFCNIETQTEFSDAFLDQMLYSNMHTQTCDEFLSELGLSDIQTQTNWSGITDDDYNNGKHDVATSGPHDELLVSTETQTSFTQCLLECSNNTKDGTCSSGLVNAITQHTQTCGTLLEGLFGSQENDLIGNFQSTHTQT